MTIETVAHVLGKFLAGAVLLAATLTAGHAAERAALYGAKTSINKRFSDFTIIPQAAGGFRARLQLTNPGGGEFRLYFDQISPGNVRFDMSVETAAGTKGTIRSEDLTGEMTYASDMFRASNFTLEITAQQPPANLDFRIRELAYRAKQPPAKLSISGDDDRKPVGDLAPDDHIRRAARSVAKIVYRDDDVDYVCTGFMISPDQLLTNYHCLGNPADCATAVFIFGYVAENAVTDQARCKKLLKTDRPADPEHPAHDFALIALDRRMGDKWGILKFSREGPKQGAKLYMPQHPDGEPQLVSVVGCVVKKDKVKGLVEADSDFSDSCDTETGASGSPMIDIANDQVVGLHHLGFTDDFPDVNRAVRAEKIRSEIQLP